MIEDLLIGGKRSLPETINQDYQQESLIKRCKQCDIKDLFHDWYRKKDEARRAETSWRKARDDMYYIQSPKSQKDTDN